MTENPLPRRFNRIERKILSQEIAQRIVALIRDGSVKANEKLPPERDLAELLGVSRPSVREALSALQLMNIIEVRQGDGTYVSSLEPEQLARSCEGILGLIKGISYLEVIVARRTIEPAIAGLAASEIRDDQIEGLRDCLERSKRVVHEPDAFLEADLALHAQIVEACGNNLLRSIYSSFVYLGIATRQKTVLIPGVRESALSHHIEIVEAIEARDPNAAISAMKAHLLDIEEAYINVGMKQNDIGLWPERL